VLDGGEWSASRPGCYICGEKVSVARWIGGRASPEAVLDTVEKSLFRLSGIELSFCGRTARNLVSTAGTLKWMVTRAHVSTRSPSFESSGPFLDFPLAHTYYPRIDLTFLRICHGVSQCSQWSSM
jgi:hypothetical protein